VAKWEQEAGKKMTVREILENLTDSSSEADCEYPLDQKEHMFAFPPCLCYNMNRMADESHTFLTFKILMQY
jgi:hypothetical protein